jgi:hypothetical protein
MLLALTSCATIPGDEPTRDALTDAPTGTQVGQDFSGESDYLLYPATDISTFAVDENAVLYTASPNMQARAFDRDFPIVVGGRLIHGDVTIGDFQSNYGAIDISDLLDNLEDKSVLSKNVPTDIPSVIFSAYNIRGDLIAEYGYVTTGWVQVMCVGGQVLYFMESASKTLFAFDLATSELKAAAILDGFESVKKIAYMDGRVLILGVHSDYVGIEYDAIPGDYFEYDGTVLAEYDMQGGGLTIVYGELAQNFALTPDGIIVVNAYDSIGGLYYAELDPTTWIAGERLHIDTNGGVGNLASDGRGIVYNAWNGSKLNQNVISYTALDEGSGVIDLVPGFRSPYYDHIAYSNGFVFYSNIRVDMSKSVERIKASAYIDDIPQIRLAATAFWNTDINPGGYNINASTMSDEEFSLAALSRDKNYDMFYISSRQDFSMNVRNKSAFYPLDDIPGVMEFLDACFPYIKAAVTDEEGNIWALPVSVDAEAIIYNAKNCEDAGIDFSTAATAMQLYNILLKAREYEYGGDSPTYSLNVISLVQSSLRGYLQNNATLDTREFRQMAEALKAIANEADGGVLWGGGGLFGPSAADSMLFLTYGNRFMQTLGSFIGKDNLQVAPLVATGDANQSTAILLCVNPDSDNLEDALAFISALSAYMTTLKDSFMLADASRYTDSAYARSLYALYENSVIGFTVSDEVIMDDFNRYLNGGIDIEKLITEADRKLRAYLGE